MPLPLRYGGGRVRGMGLYLMYPAFYTDVTDNYRLFRWARVRTDLGGFYFNVLFSLGLMGVYHATGQVLLVAALLTDIDIVHQCLPFVRLDGYWALADLTGIPDFFSFMGAYVRSVVPGLGGNERRSAGHGRCRSRIIAAAAARRRPGRTAGVDRSWLRAVQHSRLRLPRAALAWCV